MTYPMVDIIIARVRCPSLPLFLKAEIAPWSGYARRGRRDMAQIPHISSEAEFIFSLANISINSTAAGTGATDMIRMIFANLRSARFSFLWVFIFVMILAPFWYIGSIARVFPDVTLHSILKNLMLRFAR